jgi:hypothetical protein
VPGHGVEVAGTADDGLIGKAADGERELPAQGALREGVLEPTVKLRAACDRQGMGPDPRVLGGSAEGVSVLVAQRFELHPPTRQDGNFHHALPKGRMTPLTCRGRW